ncbi:hypothetical protein ILUMI_09390, partial [Ignelater luminosus]
MIELTVKTLDSQNHAFTVDDNLTIGQFKEKIADTVNIPADTQRIIYCGRLLQDESKLSDHDLNGKVVHLVQRPPPTNDRSNQRSESPPPQPHHHRRIRGLEYLGSMRFPAGAFDPNIMPPLPTHSLAASRLNVARRMLRRAEAVLTALENPTARPADQPAQEETQEEVTPIFEARVIVPSEAVVLSSVSNLLNENNSGSANNAQPTIVAVDAATEPTEADAAQPTALGIETPHSISSTPEVVSPLASSSENLATAGEEQANGTSAEADTIEPSTGNNTNSAGNSTTENISRTIEFAELLGSLSRFQTRFNPFFDQYLAFMRDDPTVSQDNARATQAMINRVSEILHFLGHAYHSLSDIIVRVRTPPPRPLLCRPILVQHSAIVQAGIPIQVEAQINFSSDRNSNNSGNNTAPVTQPSSTTATATNQTSTTTASSNSGPTITAHMQPTVVGFPLIPGTGVRVETFHLPQSASVNLDRSNINRNNNNRDNPFMSIRSTADILAQAAAAATVAAASNMAASNNASANSSTTSEPNNTTTPTPLDPTSLANAIASSVVDGLNAASGGSNATHTTTTNGSNGNAQVTVNNPNVEFFMEVTPESITIDSVETAFVGGNQANDVLQGSLNPPPPELIQSIMQMAGQLINRGTQGPSSTTTTTTATPTSSTTSATSDSSQASSTAGAARTTPFQNSQARGNTQTQPTTATHTRSTARPHVHLSQHAMQGFDPFLPCNSHHVTPRRRINQQANNQQQNSTQQNQNSTPANASGQAPNEPRVIDQNNSFHFIMRNLLNTMRAQAGGQSSQNAASTSASASGASNSFGPVWMAHLQNMQNMNLSDSSFRPPTLAQLLLQPQDDTYVEGESICTDLILMLSRNLTVGDVMNLSEGQLDPLMRIRGQLRNFFLYRILEGSQNTASVDRGVEKILTEMQPFLDHLALLNTRDDIDIVRSVQTLLRARLPNIIALVASRSPNSLKMVMDQLRTTAKHLCALAVRASENGRQGVEDIFDVIVNRYLHGVPVEFRQFTTVTSRANFCTFISNLDVPESILQPYIVRKIDAVTPRLIDENGMNSTVNNSEEVE